MTISCASFEEKLCVRQNKIFYVILVTCLKIGLVPCTLVSILLFSQCWWPLNAWYIHHISFKENNLKLGFYAYTIFLHITILPIRKLPAATAEITGDFRRLSASNDIPVISCCVPTFANYWNESLHFTYIKHLLMTLPEGNICIWIVPHN
jgi:hypothetical protein